MNSLQESAVETAHIWAHAEGNFALNVRRLRELRGMSQSQLAKDLSDIGFETFHQTTIKRIEQGIQSPKLSEALALCFVLGVTLEDSLVTEDVEFLQDADRVGVTRRPPIELGAQLASEQRLNSLARTLANQLGQLEVMQRQTRRHLEELHRIGNDSRHEATHAERERAALEGLAAQFDFGWGEQAETAGGELAETLRAINERMHTAEATPEDVLRRTMLELILDSKERTADEMALALQELVDQLKIVKAARDFKAEREQHERDKLQREIVDLRDFEREYRKRLESWLLELGDAAAFRDYSEAREIIEEGLRDLGSDHRIETSDG